eukprot:571861-Pyramimonas_sp.AAC.1
MEALGGAPCRCTRDRAALGGPGNTTAVSARGAGGSGSRLLEIGKGGHRRGPALHVVSAIPRGGPR